MKGASKANILFSEIVLLLDLLEVGILRLLYRDPASFKEADLGIDLAGEDSARLWSLVFGVDESYLLMLPIVHLVLIEAVLPLDFDFTDVGGSLDKGALCLLNHE